MKNADIFGTDEYKAVQSFYEMHPNATLKTKTIKKNPDKKTNKNYTYENMELYIKTTQGNDANKHLETMEKIKQVSQIQKNPYKYVLDWFTATYPEHKGYDIFSKSEVEENNEINENITTLKMAN